MSRIISLLTDFGNKDGYVGVVKAVILNICPEITIIDLSNEVTSRDIMEASHILKTSYKFFPAGTIFLCIVDPGVGSKRDKILVKTTDYYFIAPDNNLLSGVLSENKPERVISIDNEKYLLPEISNTFHGRDIFAPVAAHLAKGVDDISTFGTDKSIEEVQIEIDMPSKSSNRIEGKVVYIDNFGNLITNIPENLLKTGAIKVRIKNIVIEGLSTNYEDGEEGQLIALIGSHGCVELAIKNDSAREVVKVKNMEFVYIDFLNDF